MKVSCLCFWYKWIGLVVVVTAAALGGDKVVSGKNVSYDGRSLIIDGQRRILFSGSIHYPRSTPDMWPSLISKAKQGGLDVIQTYVFWNMHEPQQGQYDFSGRNDLVGFIKQIHAQGLYVNLRIGPFIEAEWNYGGFPYWLRDVPGIVFRSDNEPFKLHMKNFTTKIVNMMKSERLYASQGGPIILSQVENEYGNIEKAFGEGGQSYVLWAAEMAVQLQTGVPWIMCKQPDAPDPVINTCNGMKCGETFTGPNSPNKPALWTENWTSFFQGFGEEATLRTAENIAFQTALFIARMNGSFVNYYMYHGGTNFGRTSSAFIVTSYYDQAPLDEYGLIREPKWGHLKDLHTAVKQCSETLLSGAKVNLSLGELQDAYVYYGTSGECAAFLVNNDSRQSANVQFQNNSYQLPAKSISILPDCKTVAFNTAEVSTEVNNRLMQPVIKFQDWKVFQEGVPQYDETSLRSDALLEQMNTTKDTSDYLWYTTRFQQNSSETQAILSVQSLGHVLRAYVNGVLVGSAHGTHRFPNFTLQNSTSLASGLNNISLLSIMTGLPDSGAYLERKGAGLQAVKIQVKDGLNFNRFSWGYQIGLLGEALEVYTDEGSSTVSWSQYLSPRPLTWYKTVFDSPDGNGPVALNLGSMGKGEAWINGQSIGRYWLSFHTSSGSPSQTWYNVPRSFLRPTGGNLLVLFEEEYGSPQGISLDSISIKNVCGQSHPPPVISWKGYGGAHHHVRRHNIHLQCPERSKISRIVFASFGTPSGDCGTNNYVIGACHSLNSNDVVEKLCLGKRKCTILPSYRNFGGDPCPGMPKRLLVDAECS